MNKKCLLLCLASLIIPCSSFADTSNICLNEKNNAISSAKICPRGTKKLSLSSLLGHSIPKGTTVYGVIGGRYVARGVGETYEAFASLPSKTTPAFDSETDIQVTQTFGCTVGTCLAGEEADSVSVCTGTAANPTAPAGKVCIYPTVTGNARFLVGFNLVDGVNPNTPNGPTPASFATGFGLGWEAAATGDTYVSAVWAYKAP